MPKPVEVLLADRLDAQARGMVVLRAVSREQAQHPGARRLAQLDLLRCLDRQRRLRGRVALRASRRGRQIAVGRRRPRADPQPQDAVGATVDRNCPDHVATDQRGDGALGHREAGVGDRGHAAERLVQVADFQQHASFLQQQLPARSEQALRAQRHEQHQQQTERRPDPVAWICCGRPQCCWPIVLHRLRSQGARHRTEYRPQ